MHVSVGACGIGTFDETLLIPLLMLSISSEKQIHSTKVCIISSLLSLLSADKSFKWPFSVLMWTSTTLAQRMLDLSATRDLKCRQKPQNCELWKVLIRKPNWNVLITSISFHPCKDTINNDCSHLETSNQRRLAKNGLKIKVEPLEWTGFKLEQIFRVRVGRKSKTNSRILVMLPPPPTHTHVAVDAPDLQPLTRCQWDTNEEV